MKFIDTVHMQTLISAIVLGLVLIMPQAQAADAKSAAKQKQVAGKQKTYASPEAAAADLVAAAKAGDTKALLAVLGPGAGDYLKSGDPVADRRDREDFVAAYAAGYKLEPVDAQKVLLSVGKGNWSLPFPLVKSGDSWRFDAAAGREELLNRRIGRNETFAMQSMLAYVDAQREYYLANPQKDKLLQYAQRFISSKGKRDGLFYPTKAGESPSPMGPLFDSAQAQGYAGKAGKAAPYHGYHYKILKRQGSTAAGGAYDYLAQGRMIGGHALLAWPAAYGNSGVMTFMVNHDGVVYEKDLGPGTSAAVSKLTAFNPDSTWKKAGP